MRYGEAVEGEGRVSESLDGEHRGREGFTRDRRTLS